MKVGEIWKMRPETVRIIEEMLAEPKSIPLQVEILSLEDDMVEFVRVGKVRHHFEDRASFVKMYEKDYDA